MVVKKRALIMGLNYIGTSSALGGCINDADGLKSLLQSHFGYSDDKIVLMTDNKGDVEYPTRANILSQLDTLVREAIDENLDEIWISYSGHGSYTWDSNNDESDGLDEQLCPLDYSTNGGITDDIINSYLARVPESCNVVALFDCCHSGTMCDLPNKYQYDKGPDKKRRVREKVKKLVRRERIRKIRKRVRVAYTRNGRKRFRYVIKYIEKTIPAKYRYVYRRVWKTIPGEWKWNDSLNSKNNGKVKCQLITISGCRDPQTSADVYYSQVGEWNGALTKAFIENIKATSDNISCGDLCLRLNSSMVSQKLSQRPVICSSYNLEKTRLFYRCPTNQNTCIRL